jgi:hypothetical protein
MRTKIGIAAVVAALLLPSASWAAVWNPGFEFGLVNWSPDGDSSLETGTYGATNRLVLTSESAGQNPLGAGALDVGTLLGITGMDAGTLDATEPAGFDADTGSVVEQDFSYAWAGTATLSFDWQLFTDETLWGGGTPYADYVLIRVVEQAGPFETYELVADIESEFLAGNLVASATQYDTQSAINTFTLTALLPNPGDYTLQIVMFDVDDDEFSSAVALDDFTLVPEPETLALCAAGILGLLVAGSGGRGRRTR